MIAREALDDTCAKYKRKAAAIRSLQRGLRGAHTVSVIGVLFLLHKLCTTVQDVDLLSVRR